MAPIGSEIALADMSLSKGKFIDAAIHYYNVAEIYLKKHQEPENVGIYFKKAVDTHLQGKKYGQFVDFVKKSVKKLFEDTEQIESLKDAAGKLVRAKQLTEAAELVIEIASVYKKKPLKDSEKAKYYEILAPQIKAGLTQEIE
jgi:hypothetical protein